LQALPEDHRWITGLKALPHVRAQMRALAGEGAGGGEGGGAAAGSSSEL
jgi:hypothetical protein